VCVKGLSFNAYDSDIKDFFDQVGNVVQVKLLTRDDGKSKGIAFVKFSKKSSFNKALGLDGAEHLTRTIKVEEAQGKKNNDNNRGGNNQRGGSFGGANKFST
jgi:RNA recognition motif-containing protein